MTFYQRPKFAWRIVLAADQPDPAARNRVSINRRPRGFDLEETSMTLHRFPNRQPASSPRAGATCPGVSPPSPGQGLDDSATIAALKRIAKPPTQADWVAYIEGDDMPKPIDLPDYADPADPGAPSGLLLISALAALIWRKLK